MEYSVYGRTHFGKPWQLYFYDCTEGQARALVDKFADATEAKGIKLEIGIFNLNHQYNSLARYARPIYGWRTCYNHYRRIRLGR